MMDRSSTFAVAALTATLLACGAPPPQGAAGGGNCSFDSSAPGDDFDVAIVGGRVIDPECEFDDVRNVGIRDGRIVSITIGEISGAETIDAEGHVVTAGFIDTHHHGAGNP